MLRASPNNSEQARTLERTLRGREGDIDAHPGRDPAGIHTRNQLSAALSELRQSRGFSVRELAARLGIPPTTLSGYLTGRHLPSASQLMTFTALLAECGITDPDEVARWVAALNRARSTSDGRAARGETPYRGLEPFGRTDSAWFFGREQILADLLARIREVVADPSRPRIVPLVGASGSGKSSLLHAGLLPALDTGALGSVDLAVIDQFEEHLPQPSDELLASADVVVLGLRADFYAAAMDVPALVPALQRNQLLITPLTQDELRDVVVRPAERAGLAVEPALVDVVLADLAVAGRPHDPGALPLLSHALLATWTRTPRRELTVAVYREVGGISGAVQQTAEEVWTQLDAEDQQLARQLFLRLVNVGDETTPLTRRRIARAELDSAPSAGALDTLVDTFVARRLLTADVGAVQLSHEALLTAWPRLHAWIDDDRAGLRVHRQLTDATNVWLAAGHDPELLLTGGRLTAVADWAGEHARDLNRDEAQFLRTSHAAAEQRRVAEHQQNRQLKQLLGVVGVLTVVALVLAAIALYARGVADRQRATANRARDDALSRQVAVEVAALTRKDPALAAQLAVAAYEISPTSDARSALLGATGVRTPTRLVASRQPLQAIALQGDALAAAGADGRVHRWVVHDHGAPSALPALRPSAPGTLFALAISPDGRLLATAGAGKVVDVWSLGTGAHVAALTGFDNTIFGLAFSPDGRTLAAGGAAGTADGSVHRFDLADPAHPIALPTLTERGGYVQSVAFDATGNLLAYGTKQGALVLYRGATTARAVLASRRTVSADSALLSVAFDPARPEVVTGGLDRVLRTWQVDPAGRTTPLTVHRGFATWINGVTWDPSGTALYAASSDSNVHVVDGSSVTLLPHPQPVTAVAAGGGRVVTAGNDGTVRIWPARSSTLDGARDSVFSLAYAHNGLLAVGSADGGVALWRGDRRMADLRLPVPSDKLDGAAATSPRGDLVVAGSGNGRTAMWSVRDPSAPQYLGVLPGVETGASTTVEGVTFSADGNYVAAGGDDKIVRIWDVADPRHPRAVRVLRAATNYVFSVSFSHDGRYLAAASADDRAYVWSLSGEPRLIGHVSGFDSYAYATVFSPVDDDFAVGSADATVRLFHATPSALTEVGPRMVGATDALYSLAFAPSGRQLAGASQDGSAYVWQVDGSRSPEVTLPVGGSLSAIAFSPSGTTLAASGTDRLVHLWDSSPTRSMEVICANAGSPVSRAEWERYVPGAPYAPPCH